MRPVTWLRYHIKLLLAAGLAYSGILFLVLRRRFRQRGLVLLYHRVLPEPESGRSFSSRAIMVTPTTFEKHLRFLQRHFTVVGPEEFREWLLQERRFTKPPCLITFDDGWQDNLTHATPILAAQHLPAVIFLPTDYIGTGRLFWQERLSRLLFRMTDQPALRRHPLVVRYGLDGVFNAPPAERSGCAATLARSLKGRDTGEIDQLISGLESALPGEHNAQDVDAYLSWEDVRSMRLQQISFGSHAVTHRILTQLDPETLSHELTESRQVLERQLEAPVRLLAYPNGNHNAATCEQARRSGYELAFTTVPGAVARGDDPMALRRINIHEGAHRQLPLFSASIAGLL